MRNDGKFPFWRVYRIIAPFDFSEHSAKACAGAAAMAEKWRARI